MIGDDYIPGKPAAFTGQVKIQEGRQCHAVALVGLLQSLGSVRRDASEIRDQLTALAPRQGLL
jgi:hypothetical protein